MKSRLLVPIMVMAMALLPIAATSQGMPPMPATPVPGEAPVGVLAEFDHIHLPTPHAEVWFIRMGLDPGGSMPLQNEHGPIILVIESGELSLEIEGPVVVGGETSASEPDTLTLAAGDSLQITGAASAQAANTGNDPVTALVFMMYPAMMEGEGGEMDEPVGLSQMGIAIGTAEFPEASGSVRIERVVLDPGKTFEPEMSASEMEMPGFMGMELGAVETGSAEVVLEYAGMSNIRWPGILENQMGGPEIVAMTSTVALEAGDGYAFHGSTLVWTATGDEPATVLKVVITPDLGEMGQ